MAAGPIVVWYCLCLLVLVGQGMGSPSPTVVLPSLSQLLHLGNPSNTLAMILREMLMEGVWVCVGVCVGGCVRTCKHVCMLVGYGNTALDIKTLSLDNFSRIASIE